MGRNAKLNSQGKNKSRCINCRVNTPQRLIVMTVTGPLCQKCEAVQVSGLANGQKR